MKVEGVVVNGRQFEPHWHRSPTHPPLRLLPVVQAGRRSGAWDDFSSGQITRIGIDGTRQGAKSGVPFDRNVEANAPIASPQPQVRRPRCIERSSCDCWSCLQSRRTDWHGRWSQARL